MAKGVRSEHEIIIWDYLFIIKIGLLFPQKKTELLSKQPNNLEHGEIQEPNFNLTSQFQLVI